MQFFFLEDKGTYELWDRSELAVMSDASVGVDDRDNVSLMFTVNFKTGSSHHWAPIEAPETLRFLKWYGASDVRHLNGKLCLVVSKDHVTTHIAPYKSS